MVGFLKWAPWIATALLGWLGLKQGEATFAAASRLTKWALIGSAVYFAWLGARKARLI